MDIKKIAAGYGILAFAFVGLGSLMTGATVFTVLVRGVEAFVVFGALAWGVALWITSRDPQTSTVEENQEPKGVHLDETA